MSNPCLIIDMCKTHNCQLSQNASGRPSHFLPWLIIFLELNNENQSRSTPEIEITRCVLRRRSEQPTKPLFELYTINCELLWLSYELTVGFCSVALQIELLDVEVFSFYVHPLRTGREDQASLLHSYYYWTCPMPEKRWAHQIFYLSGLKFAMIWNGSRGSRTVVSLLQDTNLISCSWRSTKLL